VETKQREVRRVREGGAMSEIQKYTSAYPGSMYPINDPNDEIGYVRYADHLVEVELLREDNEKLHRILDVGSISYYFRQEADRLRQENAALTKALDEATRNNDIDRYPNIGWRDYSELSPSSRALCETLFKED
jgi:hypothetical protein